MEVFFNNIILWIESSKYVLLFIAVFFEGPVVMIGAGFLYSLGNFSLPMMYLVLLAGDLVADIVWYYVGYFGGIHVIGRYGHFFNITPEIINKIEKRFRTYENMILIVSKLTMGFGFALATLVTAGIMKVSIKKYLAINVIGGVIWVAFMIAVGYFFGNIYNLVPPYYKYAFAALVAVVVIFFIRWINRYLARTEVGEVI